MVKKWLVTIGMIITATLGVGSYISSLPVVIAETPDDDDVDGEFETTGFNNPMEIVSFQILNADASAVDNSNTNLNPTEGLRFNLKLKDLDSMSDLHYVEFVFHHVPSGTSITESFTNATKTSLSGSAVVFRHNISDAFITFIESDGTNKPYISDTSWGWTTSDITLSQNKFHMPVAGVTGGSLSSSGEYSTQAEDSNGNTVGAIEFNYRMSLRISRVANIAGGTNTTSGAWYLGVRIKDGRTPNNSSPSMLTVPALAVSTTDPINEPSTEFTMNWYGEVDPNGSTFDYFSESVTPGAVDMTTKSGLYERYPVGIIFYSNDVHEITIKSSPTWDTLDGSVLPKGVTQATIVSASTLTAPQTFALRIVDDALTFADSEFLTANELTLYDETNTIATNENGINHRFYTWLGLAEEFQNGRYEGIITFTIKNP